MKDRFKHLCSDHVRETGRKGNTMLTRRNPTAHRRRETQQLRRLQHTLAKSDERLQIDLPAPVPIDASASRSGTPQVMSRPRPGTRRATS
jgi:hypothetical protein